jgi:hypothetical protein
MELNVALNRVAWHSSAANYDNTAHLVTNGILEPLSDTVSSTWISGGSGTEWLTIDLDAETTLFKAVIHWGKNYARAYSVQISDDAMRWKTVISQCGKENAAVISDLGSIITRYVRVLCESSSGVNYIIREVELFGENKLTYHLALQPPVDADGKYYLTGGNWKVQRASAVAGSGPELSAAGYDDSNWLPAAVPGTVLSAYLKAGAIPDPNYNDWQFQISEAFFTADFWYRNCFTIPESQKGRRVFLNFDSINWKADVYFNGFILPNKMENRKSSIEGAFIRGKFDVSEFTRFGEENYLAVLIHKNDNPGVVTTQGLAEGPGPNGGALGADNPTLHAAIGWDWLPTIRGRCIGIYGSVYLTFGGGVALIDPWIETALKINPASEVLAAENYILRPGVKITGGDGSLITLTDGKQWIGKDSDEDGFTIDFGASLTCGSVTLLWGSEAGGAAADMESRYPEKFCLERSMDGLTWENFDAFPGGTVETGWFGPREADSNSGTDAVEGHAVSDSIQGAAAYVSIDMSAWGGGNVLPVFSPQKARYLRFTVNRRRQLNGVPVAARVRELRVYAESPTQVEQSMTRVFSLDASKADLTFRTEIQNYEDKPVDVTVGCVVAPGNVIFEQRMTLDALETKSIELGGVVLEKPRLWWPNTYGEPFLYTAHAYADIGSVNSDIKRFSFGVRQFSYPIDGGLLTLFCNGTRIVAKGGNWGMDDGLKLDLPEDYDNKVRLHKEANLTMIRNWIGMTHHPAFYEACDKYGILIWDDFWLANPVDGPDPKDPEMFLQNAADKIRRNRYHAALALYCGRNEGNPPPKLDEGLRSLTSSLDGTRLYISNSADVPVGSGGGYALAEPGGARGIKQYFNDVSSPVLRSERGIPNVPSLESLRKFIAPDKLWPISEVWALHDWTYHMNGPANSYMAALKCYLGGDFEIPEDKVQGQKPGPEDPVFCDYKSDVLKMTEEAGRAYSIDDFSRAAQMINFENHKGLFEALGVRRSNGLLMWMSQSSWPSLMWQTYDWYLDTNGGYFGVKAGNQPTRAIWDPRDDSIVLSNATPNIYNNVSTVVTIFDINGCMVSSKEYKTERLQSDAYGAVIAKADFSASSSDIVFLRLTLMQSSGETLGESFYWHNRRVFQDYHALNSLPEAEVEISSVNQEPLIDGNIRYSLTLKNVSVVPCIQLRIRTLDTRGADVLPVFYSDNYFALLPGETKTMTAELHPNRLRSAPPRFVLSGWNTKQTV